MTRNRKHHWDIARPAESCEPKCTGQRWRGGPSGKYRWMICHLSVVAILPCAKLLDTPVTTPWAIKMCLFILDHNSSISWWISTLCEPMKTGRNTLLGNYKICNVTTTVALHYLRQFKNTQNSMTVGDASCFMFDRTRRAQPSQKVT